MKIIVTRKGRQTIGEDKIFAIYVSDKRLYLEYIKNSQN